VIVGVGTDIVEIARFQAALARTPALRIRLFTENERNLPLRSLAARFAAKEALAKALGAPAGLRWLDATVARDPDGRPRLRVEGSVAERARQLGVTCLHLSLSHDGGLACALVLAESARPAIGPESGDLYPRGGDTDTPRGGTVPSTGGREGGP
jgi:holo-[acyl-carrier protein] synthase